MKAVDGALFRYVVGWGFVGWCVGSMLSSHGDSSLAGFVGLVGGLLGLIAYAARRVDERNEALDVAEALTETKKEAT